MHTSNNMGTALKNSTKTALKSDNTAMQKQLLLLTAALLCAAWTLEADIGSGAIKGEPVKNLHIAAESPDLKNWHITGSAERVQNMTGIQINGRAIRENWSLILTDLTASARRNQAPLTIFLARPVKLAELLRGCWQTPENLSLQIQNSGIPVLRLQWTTPSQTLTLVQTPINAVQLTALLHFASISLKNLQGIANPQFTLTRNLEGWHLSGSLNLENAGWHSADSLQTLEKVHARLNIDAQEHNGRWRANFSGAIDRGEILVSPLYLNLNDSPINLKGSIAQTDTGLDITSLKAESPGLIAHLSLQIRTNRITRLHIEQLSGDIQTLYSAYLKPYLTDTILDDASLTGSFYLSADWQPGKIPQNLTAVLNNISIADNNSRFALNGLDGQLGTDGISTLRIGKSRWKKLPFGPAVINLRQHDGRISLASAATIPILDGGITISRLRPLDADSYQLKLAIHPIDLEKLTTELELPILKGSISGTIPDVRISKNAISFSQPVHLNALGGKIDINDLHINNLFSAAPLLYLSLNIDCIDLDTLTRVLNVAQITGNLSGQINNLALLNWQPQQFDARLETPMDNPGKRRISHEAVQYFTQAGGASAAIGQFVRVLNQFPYEKLGFTAQLQGDKLTINGVAPAENGGFYLVKGSGLPHLDIIGRQHETSFHDLINRINAAIHSDSPVIQ